MFMPTIKKYFCRNVGRIQNDFRKFQSEGKIYIGEGEGGINKHLIL